MFTALGCRFWESCWIYSESTRCFDEQPVSFTMLEGLRSKGFREFRIEGLKP